MGFVARDLAVARGLHLEPTTESLTEAQFTDEIILSLRWLGINQMYLRTFILCKNILNHLETRW